MIGFSNETIKISEEAERLSAPLFLAVDKISEYNTRKVISAFAANRVSDTMFMPSRGYGYDDRGRDTLDKVYAGAFGCEDALVRPQFINGTHALSVMLFALLKPNVVILSVTGKLYDTLRVSLDTLKEIGVIYNETALPDCPDADYLENIKMLCADIKPSVVYIQKSKGYGDRITLSSRDIKIMTAAVKNACPSAIVAVDNCYGEFCEPEEPVGGYPEGWDCDRMTVFPADRPEVPADIMAGSLIKNPGGGLASCGGYIAGRKDLVDTCGERLTVPGIGREAGSNPEGWRLYYQGFFLAPHVTAQAVKTAIFASNALEIMGYKVLPKGNEMRGDIIETVHFGSEKPLVAFCRGIQKGSPVDSYVTPEPWDMPGYDSKIIMAAGAFVQGSSIELSADAPIREPYILYMQGGLTYESGKYGIMTAIDLIAGNKSK